jgi:hypothetical protein
VTPTERPVPVTAVFGGAWKKDGKKEKVSRTFCGKRSGYLLSTEILSNGGAVMSIVSERGETFEAINSESDYAGGFTVSFDHEIIASDISLHTSLCRMVETQAKLRGAATIGIAEFGFKDENGKDQTVIFGPAPSGLGGVGNEDKWAAQIWSPRVFRFTIAAFAVRAAMKGSWFLQSWK